jgi:hypothetical protein
MKGHIIIDELFVPEDSVLEKTMIGNMISIKIEVGGSHTSLLEGQVDLTPFKVIAGVVAHFQRKRVFTPIETGVLALTIEASIMTIPFTFTLSFYYRGYICWGLYMSYC